MPDFRLQRLPAYQSFRCRVAMSWVGAKQCACKQGFRHGDGCKFCEQCCRFGGNHPPPRVRKEQQQRSGAGSAAAAAAAAVPDDLYTADSAYEERPVPSVLSPQPRPSAPSRPADGGVHANSGDQEAKRFVESIFPPPRPLHFRSASDGWLFLRDPSLERKPAYERDGTRRTTQFHLYFLRFSSGV